MPIERELTTIETGLWRSRLEHSHRVWKSMGLHDESQGYIHAKKFLNFYKGIHFHGEMTIAERAGLVRDNVFFSAINTLSSLLYARHPVVDVIAEVPNQKDAAQAMEHLENHLIRSPRIKMKREFNMTLLNALLLKFGILRHGFTPEEERVDDVKEQWLPRFNPAQSPFPWVRSIDPWDIRIDPLARTFHPDDDARWCAFLSLHFLDEIKSGNSPFIARRDLKPTRSIAARFGDPYRKTDENPDENQLIEVWTVWDKMKREVFALSPGSDRPLTKARPWPLPWESLPYDFLQFNPTPGDPFGTSYSEQAIPLQEELNWLLTMTNSLARSLRRIIPFDSEGLAEGEEDKFVSLALVEFLKLKPGRSAADVFGEIKVGGGFQELLPLILFIKDELRTLLGISEMDRANRINVESATEASQVQRGAAAQRGRNQGPWEDFLSSAFTKFGLALQHTATDPIVIPIIGREDAAELFGPVDQARTELRPADIEGEFLYLVRPGSTLPRNPAEDIQRETALNSALQVLNPELDAVSVPQRMIDTVRAFEKDPKRQLADQTLLAATQNRLPANGSGGGSPNVAPGIDQLVAGLGQDQGAQ